MGIDFIKRTARTFHKGLDWRRIEAAIPRLFTQQPASIPRTYAAQLCAGQKINSGEKLGVRLDGQHVLAMRGLDLVATINSPSAELLKALSDGHGEASAVVHQVHDMARMAEISVC